MISGAGALLDFSRAQGDINYGYLTLYGIGCSPR